MGLVRRHKVLTAVLVILVVCAGIAQELGLDWLVVTITVSLLAGIALLTLDVRGRARRAEQAAVAARRASRDSARALRDMRHELTRVRRRTRRIQASVRAARTGVSSLRGDLRLAEKSAREADRKILASLETEREDAALRHREVLRQPGVKMAPPKPRDQLGDLAALFQLTDRIHPRALLPAPVGFAMNPRSLLHLADIVERTRPKTVLELGSGASTVWLAYLLERSEGARLVSVDHLEGYAAATRAELERHGLEGSVDLRVAPLVVPPPDIGDTPWYDISQLADVRDVDLLLVDGPPLSTGPHARRAALYSLADRLSPHAVILLDNAEREDEQEVLEAWMGDFELERIEIGVSRLAVLRRRR